jgi:DNA-binding response OmpR family regulator
MEQPQQTTVLLVDDEQDLLDLLRDFLEAAGFGVQVALSGAEALRILAATTVDCVLLDVMLPELSGFDLCRKIREHNDLPILFLSARDTDLDKIRGLGLGGDDYITKSASHWEVVARIKAVMRRYQQGRGVSEKALLDFGRLVLDVKAHEVRIDGQAIPFTGREFALLCFLAEHPRQIFTHGQLFEQLWGDVGDRHAVAVHIARIREKIEVHASQPDYIVTVWGVGYRFEGKRR